MTTAWAVFIPVGVWFARYGKPLTGNQSGFSSND